jgi:hypothetical protein
MGITKRVLESNFIKAVALIVGLIAGIVRLVNFALPNAVKSIITGSLILVGAYFAILIIQFLIKIEFKKLSSRLNNPNNNEEYIINTSEAEQAYTYAARRYGVGYELIEIRCNINNDGSATVQRIVEVKAYSQIRELDTYLLVSPESPSSDGPWEMKLGKVRSLTLGMNVTLIDAKQEHGIQSAKLSISPPLLDGANMTYEMLENLPVDFYAVGYTNKQLEERKASEDHFGWNINRPTRKLTILVSFPRHAGPHNYRSEVRYASASGFPASRIQYEEQQRLSPEFEPDGEGRYTLKLEVNFPMHGLIYILRWQPVALEIKRIQTGDMESLETAKQEWELEFLVDLRQIFTNRFSEGELRALCFDLGVDYNNLPGQGRSDKVIELISFLERRRRIPELVNVLKQLRPDISWPEQPE